MDISKLDKLYKDADDADRKVYAEMRNNLMLVDGQHYKKTQDRLDRALTGNGHSGDQKLRLTKNHIQVVSKEYKNSIQKLAPWVKPTPHNENEMQDMKAAELSKDVWDSLKYTHRLKEKKRDWVDNFVDIGEVHVKITWNPNKGDFIGFKQKVNEQGLPVFKTLLGVETVHQFGVMGEQNQPVAGDEAMFTGDVDFETIPGYDIFRCPQAQSLCESPFIGVRKMKRISEIKDLYQVDEKVIEQLSENDEETFQVFDSNTNTFDAKKGMVMLREFYYRPCKKYPQGKFFHTAKGVKLTEGDLPFGIFPIVSKEFEKIQGSCRGKSIIRPLRPAQAEINRTASHIAMTQLVHGSSKVFVQNGTKISKNINLPGMRIYNYTGATPITQDGKAGDQFYSYLEAQVRELYQLANLQEIMAEKPASADPISTLQASMRHKKKFVLYAEKFEEFLCEVCETALEVVKNYYDEERLVQVVGKKERINIMEFKGLTKFDYAIKLEPVSEDIDTQMGKMQNIQTVLQYVGKDIPEETRGKLIRALPFVNSEEFFDELTVDEDNIKNDILALDRGEMPQINKYDNNEKYIKRIIHRMKQADFRFLDDQIKMNYAQFLSQHQETAAQKQKELQEAQAGFIPTGGGIVKVDAYETVTNSDGKPSQRRMMFPAEAIQWLKGKLDTQGSSQQSLANVNDQALIEMAQMLDQGNEQAQVSQQPAMPPRLA